ncbi:hypothetical protein [Acetobacter oryzifermentans]|nr:hypothetical protein [Acetobacter oryzifermentans]
MTLPDEAIFRKAMSHLATGVSVVTAKGVDGEHGATTSALLQSPWNRFRY